MTIVVWITVKSLRHHKQNHCFLNPGYIAEYFSLTQYAGRSFRFNTRKEQIMDELIAGCQRFIKNCRHLRKFLFDFRSCSPAIDVFME